MVFAAAPDWTETARNLATLAQALGFLGAGVWAYYKFVRGRTFKHRADFTLEARLVRAGEQKAVSVAARFQNTGSVYIYFTRGENTLTGAGVWGSDALTPGRSPYWGEEALMHGDLFHVHRGCEPGETITDHVLLPVPPPPEPGRPWLAYRVEAHVDSPNRTGANGRPRPWVSTIFVMDGLEERSLNSEEIP